MDPRFFGQSEDNSLLLTRLKKMTSKNLGTIYYNLPQSKDPQSVLYSPVLSLDDLDRMGEGF